MLSTRYSENFEFITLLRVKVRVYVESIGIIRNEYLFYVFMGNESERGTTKSPENSFAVHAIFFVPRRARCKFAGAIVKFSESKSKLKVKVTCLKLMAPSVRSCRKANACQIWKPLSLMVCQK